MAFYRILSFAIDILGFLLQVEEPVISGFAPPSAGGVVASVECERARGRLTKNAADIRTDQSSAHLPVLVDLDSNRVTVLHDLSFVRCT